MQTAQHIVHAKWILSGVPKQPALENHSLCITDGKIQAVLPTSQVQEHYTAARVDNYLEHLIMPGIINAHTHIGMNYFRGLGSDLSLMDWLHKHMFPTEKKWLSHAFVYDASLFAMAEMIRSGTTCYNDMFYFSPATAEATIQSGMRACIGITVAEFPTKWAKTTDEYFTKGLDFYEQYKDNPYITTTFAPHAPYTVSDESFIRIRELADKFQLKINLHLHETLDEINQSMQQFKKRPVRRIYDLGLLSPQLIAIHCANLNEEDLDLFAQTQPNVVHCPESNMKLASGICPVDKLRDIGVNVALGTDSVASNNDLDMLSEMRSASLLAKISTLNPESLKAHEALELATINGAKAIGLEHTTGSLEVNKAADFIAINMQDIEMLPVFEPEAQVVYSSNRQQVSDVWVSGKQLMKNHELLTIDEQALKQKAKSLGKKIKTS
ncbi:MAG: TRZ/ATZ family hydrolase [Legionellaceae bacterium]|nr:TRZ/ATZ family hydrolase [Legionellaceae bacterium]